MLTLFRQNALTAAMADNNLARELRSLSWAAWRQAGAIAALGVAAFSAVAIGEPRMLDKAIFASVVWTLLCVAGQSTHVKSTARSRSVASGLQGETYVCKTLLDISPDYVVRNQVLLPNTRSRTGHTEVDFILVGKKALYLVETKNNAGTIQASEDGREWVVEAASGKHSMRNPVSQVRIQHKVLQQRLTERGITVIVQPSVAFSSPLANLMGDVELSVPVFMYPLSSLQSRITAYERKLGAFPDIDQAHLLATLDELHAEAKRVSKPIR